MQGFLEYAKHAFLFRWHLLALGAGAAVGVISGSLDVVLPLLMAGEVTYLCLLATNRKFQAAIDANKLKQLQLGATKQAQVKTEQMLEELRPDERRKYIELKQRCIALNRIAGSIKGAHILDETVTSAHSKGINRLLWIYLKLLYSKNAIEKFFETTDKHQILRDMQAATERLSTLGPEENDTPNLKRRRASLTDQLATCAARLENYQRAEDNCEFIKDEIGRLFTKIVSLAEMVVSRQDPDVITSEVDIVSDSVESSEKAMSELDFLTGWSVAEEAAPDLFAMDDGPKEAN